MLELVANARLIGGERSDTLVFSIPDRARPESLDAIGRILQDTPHLTVDLRQWVVEDVELPGLHRRLPSSPLSSMRSTPVGGDVEGRCLRRGHRPSRRARECRLLAAVGGQQRSDRRTRGQTCFTWPTCRVVGLWIPWM